MKNINIIKFIQYGMLANLCLLAAFNCSAQDRNVGWVHGLGENGATWNIYHSMFDTERRMNGTSQGYPSFTGVAAAAANVTGDMVSAFGSAGSTAPQNIGIGHSMGGLAIREIDRTQTGANQRFGGLITVGTPNHGARIINSIQDGEVQAAMQDACLRMSAGPFSEIPSLVVFATGINHFDFCDWMEAGFLTPNLGPNFATPSHNDLREGSAFLTALNGSPSNAPVISIWGAENSPVHWRLVSSFESGNANDTDRILTAYIFADIYYAFFSFHLHAGIAELLNGIFYDPTAFSRAALHFWRMSQWLRGYIWIVFSEVVWSDLIGCVAYEETITYTTTYDPCACFEGPGQGAEEQWEECICYECDCDPDGCMVTETVTETVVSNRFSDGLLCDYTQIYDGSIDGDVYPALGVNHNEETNTTNGTTNSGNDEMGRVFRLVWDRTDFFQTPVR